jgi:hypothetical protein
VIVECVQLIRNIIQIGTDEDSNKYVASFEVVAMA